MTFEQFMTGLEFSYYILSIIWLVGAIGGFIKAKNYKAKYEALVMVLEKVAPETLPEEYKTEIVQASVASEIFNPLSWNK